MRNTLFLDPSYNQVQIREWLANRGMTFPEGELPLLAVELTHYPLVLDAIETAGPPDTKPHALHGISSDGVILWIYDGRAGDEYVFIPMCNIAAIHTIDRKAFLERLKDKPSHVGPV